MPSPKYVEILSRLLPPMQFSASDAFRHLHTLRAFEATVVQIADKAEAAGWTAGDSAELKKAIRGFDTMGHASRVNALRVLLKQLQAAGVPLSAELVGVANGGEVGPKPVPLAVEAPPAPEEPAALRPRQKALPLGRPATGTRGRAGAEGASEEVAPGTHRQPLVHFTEGPLAAPPKQFGRIHSRLQGVLTKKGLLTAADILYLLPRAYEDRRHLGTVSQWQPGNRGSALVEVKRVEDLYRGRRMVRVVFGDDSGTVAAVFFNGGAWLKTKFPVGERFLISGELRASPQGREVVHPEVEPAGDWAGPGSPRPEGASASLHFERIVPIYPGFERGEQRTYRELAARVVETLTPHLEDPLPEELRRRLALPSLGETLRELHLPRDGADLDRLGRWSSGAHRRLAFDELFFLQLGLTIRRQGIRVEPGIAFQADQATLDRAIASLPFALTAAQRRVVGEIVADMRRSEPMNRLLQGDVGSGKTAVALLAAQLALADGFQVAVMAPTELLASQHARTMGALLRGDRPVLLVGSVSAKERERILAGLADGSIPFIVGTHALLEDDVVVRKLGLVIIDEQHRFGVLQRGALRNKGLRPDVLVMTATPIPRTLAMAAYGDLDLSVIDELPPGRTPIKTQVFDARHRAKAHDLVRAQLAEGRQAYVVYPLVEESEKSDLASATEGLEQMRAELKGFTVGLLHGRMKQAEKDATMADFRSGKLQALVATTVVEVGVDVPNATVMLIENAERFGLSQLHQLRGRVGRGAHSSYCLLVASSAQGALAKERLGVMEESSDGFVIAERDLELRGPGEFLGTRQSGLPELAVANLARDQDLLAMARREAQQIVGADPHLTQPAHRGLLRALDQRWEGKLVLAKIG